MYVIFNPASGRGRGRKRIARYRALLEERIPDVRFAATEGPGHESTLADRALADGVRTVVAVGGDGTWGNVADRVVASGRDDVRMGLLPNGTGNDFGRSLGIRPDDPEAAVEVLAAGHERQVDVGRVDTLSASEHHPDRWEERYFLNLIGFGFDIAVIDAAARARFLKGELLYKITALQQLFRFPGFQATVRPGEGGEGSEKRSGEGGQGSEERRSDDGRGAAEAPSPEAHLMLTVSNGRYFGGGFPIAPDAGPADGRLHTCSIGDAAPFTRLRLFNLAERGRHVESDRVRVRAGAAFHLDFPEPPRFEMDGDVRQARDRQVRVRVIPKALRVLAPRDHTPV